MEFDVQKIRNDFPVLSQKLSSGKNLVYFDNAATAQKPISVIDAVANFYKFDNSNIHRSAHELSERSTTGYENARKKVLKFVNAPSDFCAVFTRGATEALNIVASSWGGDNLKEGDEIVVSQMEHHANIVPWQIIAQKTGAKLRTIKITPDGSLDLDEAQRTICQKTKIVSITHASNVLGTINDINTIGEFAKNVGAKLSIDAAQSSPHLLDDITKFDCDFLSFSSHKCFGPTGCGALVAKQNILDNMSPYQSGGDMIDEVSWEGTTFRPAPERFEAGTPHIAGAIGLGAAIDYIESIDIEGAIKHEHAIVKYLTEKILEIEGVKVYAPFTNKVSVVSFSCDGVHPNDIAVMLNASGVAIRTGHHCAQPLMKTLGVDATARASLAFYNTFEEIDYFIKSLNRALMILR